MTERQAGEQYWKSGVKALIVWLHSLKQAKMLRKFGNVHYVSKRLKYVVVYCNMEDAERIIAKIAFVLFCQTGGSFI
jgi:uncharacterized protein YlbG (UPF0298 family)